MVTGRQARVPFIAAWARPDPANPHQRRLPIAAGAAAPAGRVVDGTRLDVMLTGRRDSAKPDEFLMHFPHEHRTNYFTAFRRGSAR